MAKREPSRYKMKMEAGKCGHKYPQRERIICHCGGVIFKGLNDGSEGATIKHVHLRKSRVR